MEGCTAVNLAQKDESNMNTDSFVASIQKRSGTLTR